MRCPQRQTGRPAALVAPLLACLLSTLVPSLEAHACELVLTEHRSGLPLTRLAVNPDQPAADVAFTHSVLGTPVLDRYVWRHSAQGWRAYIVEERFEGEGYGLPADTAPGESLQRDGAGWRLQLDRLVDPFVILPLPAQSMRLVLGDQRVILLGPLSLKSIEIRVENCPLPR